MLAALAIARTWRTFRLFDNAAVDWNGCEAQCLLVGALLVTACFFAGQNVDYRGIYFLLTMPGLVRLYRTAGDPAIRRFLARMIAAVLFVAWEEPLRDAVHTIAVAIAGEWLRLRIELLFWIGRELVWWWLIAGLAAMILCCALRMPLSGGRLGALAPFRPIGGARRHAKRLIAPGWAAGRKSRRGARAGPLS